MDFVENPVTVAFSLDALEQLERPHAVFDQTQGWARSVGIVSDRPVHAQTSYARTHGLDYGFHSGPRTLRDSLSVIGARPEQEADRYLLIGTEDESSAVEGIPWEFLSITEAAEAAGWTLDIQEPHQDWP